MAVVVIVGDKLADVIRAVVELVVVGDVEVERVVADFVAGKSLAGVRVHVRRLAEVVLWGALVVHVALEVDVETRGHAGQGEDAAKLDHACGGLAWDGC